MVYQLTNVVLKYDKGNSIGEESEMMEVEFKYCDCPIESWEVIIVDNDDQFGGRGTIYYHCDECGEDYAILDYYSGEILYLNPKLR